jgi:hypothetical protein
MPSGSTFPKLSGLVTLTYRHQSLTSGVVTIVVTIVIALLKFYHVLLFHF